MTTKTYKNILILLVLFNCPYIYGQLSYDYNGASYTLSQKKDLLKSEVVFNQAITSSRMLNAEVEQARLKSAELMGIYLLFTRTYHKDELNSDLFRLFVKYYGKGFEANVSEIRKVSNSTQSGARTLEFECPEDMYHFKTIALEDLPSLSDLCKLNYKNERSISSASLYMEYCNISPSEHLALITGFLSKQNAPLPAMYKCFGLYPGIIFETSLYTPDDLIKALQYELLAEMETADDLTRELLLIDLVTIAPDKKRKDQFYNLFIESLKRNKNLWDDILVFANKNSASKEEPLDMLDALCNFPGALNLNLFSGSNQNLYNKAAHFFNENQQDSALVTLRESINFNGVTFEKISLAAAIFRMKEQYEKSLAIATFCAFKGLESAFVSGNLYLSLKALKYKRLEELKIHLSKDINIDDWSRTVILQTE